jgi:hypothetical protein
MIFYRARAKGETAGNLLYNLIIRIITLKTEKFSGFEQNPQTFTEEFTL